MSTTTTISSLEEVTSPLATDVIPIVNDGETKKVQLRNIKDALDVASTLSKGLMSAADKASLQQALLDIDSLLDSPSVATVASASVISVPDGKTAIILTGNTNVATVLNTVNYRVYVFYYPSGSGISFLGTAMTAGSVLVAVATP